MEKFDFINIWILFYGTFKKCILCKILTENFPVCTVQLEKVPKKLAKTIYFEKTNLTFDAVEVRIGTFSEKILVINQKAPLTWRRY